MTMATNTTPTDIRYEYMHIDMTNIFLYLFAKIISLPYFRQLLSIFVALFSGKIGDT
jgi:hypothetical protein